MAYWPGLAFADYVGPSEMRFALVPRKLWNGAWTWLRYVERKTAVVHWHLTPGGGDSFFVYSLPSPQEAPNDSA